MLATVQLVDVDKAYQTAKELIEAAVTGSELKAFEPTTPEFGANAVAVTATSPDGTDFFVLDAKSDNPEVFEPDDTIASLVERLGSGLEVESSPLAANEEAAAALEPASHFRAEVVIDGEPIGELRFSTVVESVDEGAPSASDDQQPNENDDQPSPANSEPPAPDMAALAGRLPNLASVNMDVTVELGRVRLPIKELLALDTGSVVRLGTPIGESFDILVNGKAAARGDLVVVGGKLAVRIRELLGIEA